MIDDALADLFERVARGELRVVVGPAYPLEQSGAGPDDLAERRTTARSARPDGVARLVGREAAPARSTSACS